MFIVYDFLYAVFILIRLPQLFLKKKLDSKMTMRFGLFPRSLKEALPKKKTIWIHAVSVGELLASLKLINALKTKYPQYPIVCTTVTKTGYEVGRERLSGIIVLYAPMDFPCSVAAYIRYLNPRIYLSMETEIWPRLFNALHKKNIPAVIINGRISDKSFKGYLKAKFFIKKIVSWIDLLCMQSELDKERILQLGAVQDRILVVGNVKFEQDAPHQGTQPGLNPKGRLWIAGSTHPGEEEIVLNIYKNLSKVFKDLVLMIAPRHVERTEEVIKLIEGKQLKSVKLSEAQNITPETIVVVDTIGKLRNLYALAEVVFIGKTLKGEGGQNMIEPALCGKAVIVGPHTENFKDVMQILLKGNAIIQVPDSEALESEIQRLLENPDITQALGKRAKSIAEGEGGAVNKTIQAVSDYLKD